MLGGMVTVAGVAASVMLREGADAADIAYRELCIALSSIGAIVP